MSSPVKIPFKSIIQLDRLSATAVYLQIARQMINAIQRGLLAAGVQLPGSRNLAELLEVHRKTIVAAYEEMHQQGWIEIRPNHGTYVIGDPTQLPQPVQTMAAQPVKYPAVAGYAFERKILLDIPGTSTFTHRFEFTDGTPDERLAPLDKLSRAMSGILKGKNNVRLLKNSEVRGNVHYREVLAEFLNHSRGLPIGRHNILTTKGGHMGIYLTSALLIKPGDSVVVGKPSYFMANMIFQQTGARIVTIPVDQHGISTEALQKVCDQKPPRMVYITPHHHYPTTVTLSTERRLELLRLAEKYRFIILEDDNDYDFHYHNSPILPLASADQAGMVVYVGSFASALAPGLQSGYIVAPENLISELAKLRHIIDKQGDIILEQALAELLTEGEIQRHLKKALKIYHERRSYFCQLLDEQFPQHLSHIPPPGGLAAWTTWKQPVNLLRLSKACSKKNLHLPQTCLYQTGQLTAMRLGFGNMNKEEMEQALLILQHSLYATE